MCDNNLAPTSQNPANVQRSRSLARSLWEPARPARDGITLLATWRNLTLALAWGQVTRNTVDLWVAGLSEAEADALLAEIQAQSMRMYSIPAKAA